MLFTSDMHLGHANIAAYCNRPGFKPEYYKDGRWVGDAERQEVEDKMSDTLIHNWNSRVKPDDTVFHVGDFCSHGPVKGVRGSRSKAQEWERRLNGQVIHIRGNHDSNNSVKVAAESLKLWFGKRTWLLVHIPPDKVPVDIDVVLCGHVHQAWKHKVIDGRPVINVGTDVWDWKPITKQELIVYCDRLLSSHI